MPKKVALPFFMDLLTPARRARLEIIAALLHKPLGAAIRHLIDTYPMPGDNLFAIKDERADPDIRIPVLVVDPNVGLKKKVG
jgi:hypothetical protein